jgi:hypothetical protein
MRGKKGRRRRRKKKKTLTRKGAGELQHGADDGQRELSQRSDESHKGDKSDWSGSEKGDNLSDREDKDRGDKGMNVHST